MKVLVIDPASSTGYCVLEYDKDKASADIIDWGFIEIKPSEVAGDRYVNLLEQITKLIEDNNVEKVALEDYFFSKRSPQGANLNCSYRAMIHMKCSELNLPYQILNISLWKKYVNGRSTSTKEQKAKWGKEPSKKLMTQESLWTKWGIKFPNHSLSLKTGKPIKFRYDVVDAVAMAIFYASIYLRVNTIEYSVDMIDDHKWKKIPSGIYNYGDK